MKKIILLLILVVVIVVSALYFVHTSKATSNQVPATVEEVKEMVKLCAMEIHDDVPMRDSINGKWIFAKGRINGQITFDVERLDYTMKGDTLLVTLPPEVVEIYESTDKNSYRVYDTWDNTLLGAGQLTTAEENTLKERMKQRYVQSVYERGYVDRARRTAIETLSTLFSKLETPVIFVDR